MAGQNHKPEKVLRLNHLLHPSPVPAQKCYSLNGPDLVRIRRGKSSCDHETHEMKNNVVFVRLCFNAEGRRRKVTVRFADFAFRANVFFFIFLPPSFCRFFFRVFSVFRGLKCRI